MPASILQQLHTVVLGAGATVVIPHVLTDAIRALIPNVVMPDRDTPIRVTVVTNASVTYENTDGANAQTAVFRVQWDHTIQQATPTDGNPQLNFYYQGGGAGGGGTGIVTDYIFQPGGGGTGPVVFEDWATLVAALATARAAGGPAPGGYFVIQFDDSVAPCAIPDGNWDMTNVEWHGRIPANRTNPALAVEVTIADATFVGLRRFRSYLQIFYDPVGEPVPPVSDFVDGDQVDIREYVHIASLAANAPFFDCSGLVAGESCRFTMEETAIGDGAQVTILGPPGDPAPEVQFVLLDGTLIEVDSIDIPNLELTILGNSARVESQSAGGTVTTAVLATPRWNVRGPFAGGTTINDTAFGDFLLCNPDAADVTVNLPNLNRRNEGSAIVVKSVDDAGAFNINVVPSGAETIDGVAAPYVMTVPRSSITLVSDGQNNWNIE